MTRPCEKSRRKRRRITKASATSVTWEGGGVKESRRWEEDETRQGETCMCREIQGDAVT